MLSDSIRKSFRLAVIFFSVGICSQAVSGQVRCLSSDEVKRMLTQLTSHQSVSFDQHLSDKLVELRQKDQRRVAEGISDNKQADELFKRLKESREKNAVQLCQVLKTYGWPTRELIGTAGVEAAFFLLKNSSFELQVDLLPVVIAAVRQGALPPQEFPGYVDLLRLRTGLKQIFGTQATIMNGFLVLFPIEAEAQVDARRKVYGLGPLAEYLRFLEMIYRLPLVKSTGALTNSFSDSVKSSVAMTTATGLFEGQTVEENEVLRIDTNLVSLNVSVYSNKLRTHVSMLEQKDFAVTEDGRAESISFFATTDVPFDLVLLLDLSGSTSSRRDLIRKSTRRFIEAARPSDRLAIVTFADAPTVVSPLTEDRKKLLESVDKIEGTGGSNVWDALKFTLDQVLGAKTVARRRAVVFMTDGVDNSLASGYMGAVGSQISFAGLLEAVRRDNTLIIPIYLDTGAPYDKRLSESARKTLELLADESGGLFYKAKKVEDLDGVYSQVIEDLGKIYSLGYKPTNEKRDGSWRTVKIEILNRPDLMARARPGYYSN